MDKKMAATESVRQIRERRLSLGINYIQLAAMSGVTRNNISRAEKGKQIPHWATRQKLRRALGMPEERYFTVQQRNEIFLTLNKRIWKVIYENKHTLQVLNADLDDVYQELSLCALRALDRYQSDGAATPETYAMKNVAAYIKTVFCYFRCHGLSGESAKSLESGTVVSLDAALEAGWQI